jgi:hypothetical protein
MTVTAEYYRPYSEFADPVTSFLQAIVRSILIFELRKHFISDIVELVIL